MLHDCSFVRFLHQGCFLLHRSEPALKPDGPMPGVPPSLGGDWGKTAFSSSVWHGFCPPCPDIHLDFGIYATDSRRHLTRQMAIGADSEPVVGLFDLRQIDRFGVHLDLLAASVPPANRRGTPIGAYWFRRPRPMLVNSLKPLPGLHGPNRGWSSGHAVSPKWPSCCGRPPGLRA